MIIIERALSLTQPYATLMAIGAKKVETRAWRTHFRGWVAIHAAKAFPMECRVLCDRMPFGQALAEYNSVNDLPLGQILAVTEIVHCEPTEQANVTELEAAFGNYAPGRFAIITAGVRRLKIPIQIRGALSIWRLQNPITEADLVAQGEHLARTALNPRAAWPFPTE